MVRILSVERGPCDLWHGILEHCPSGSRLVTYAHWLTEEDARLGSVSVADQIDAELSPPAQGVRPHRQLT